MQFNEMINQVICGDCLEVMKDIPDNSVDAIITDPPYELGFMGKKWDNSGIAYNINVWTEALRVLKPGGFLLSFGGTRTYHRMVCAIEDAGFEIRDCIMWIYGSGFPKSLNIGKQIDKMGKGYFTEFSKMLKEYREKKGLSMKEIAIHFPSKSGGVTGCYWNWEKGDNAPTLKQYNKLIEILDIPLEKAEEVKREIIGQKTHGNPCNWYANMDTKSRGQGITNITIPSTSEAKQWEGWGTALKPAVEPIVVARKPLSEKNVALNVLKWGTGGINIDECRIGTEIIKCGNAQSGNNEGRYNWNNGNKKEWKGNISQGRFPANIILDEETGKMLDEQSGISKGTERRGFPGGKTFGGSEMKAKVGQWFGDKGGASRFFYCAKAGKSERNKGCEELETKDWCFSTMGTQTEEAIRKRGRNPDNQNKPMKNNHPTVKPVKLIEYLIKLVSRKNAVILDPFLGSGTTAVACVNMNRKFVGIELNAEYIEIAKKRIEPFLEQKRLGD
jgi:DNA modification methylase